MKRTRTFVLRALAVAALAAPVFAAENGTNTSQELLIDDFDHGLTHGVYTGRRTSIGAYQGTWARRPSYSLLRKSEIERRGTSGKGAALEWKKEGGWCGWYSLLRDGAGRPANATPYNTLSFWIRGEKGGEKFDIGLSDSRMQELEIDAVYAGSVNTFLPGGVTTNWQEVRVPLSRWESSLDLSALGSLVFWFSEGGGGRIFFDDIKLRTDPDVARIEEFNAPRAERDPAHPRSLWVWKLDPINNTRARQELLDLCRNAAIDTMYLFFGDFNAAEDPAYTAQLERFLEQCHTLGIHVEALTGNPVWSLRANHPLCLQWIRSFLDYNKPRPQAQRFDGVSLDVEPYLTGEWSQDRAAVKEQYLELLHSCRELIDGYHQPFVIGAAIPMAYQQEEEKDGFESKAIGYLDYVALMAYYDTPKKVIDNSSFHIALAGRLGKKTWLGVEIQDLVQMKQGNRQNTFWEEGWLEMENVLGAIARHFNSEPGFGGFAMHCDYAYKLLPRGRNVPHKDRPLPENSTAFTLRSRHAARAPVLDGRLDEWDLSAPLVLTGKLDVASGRGAWAGPDDLGVRAYSEWDPDNLYLAFDVSDNAVVQEKGAGDMWEGDHVEFWLDSDLLGDYTEMVNSGDDFQFGFSPGNFRDRKPEVFLWMPYVEEDYVSQIEVAAAKTDRGYNLEIRIPRDFIVRSTNRRTGVDPAPQGREPNTPLSPAPTETPAPLAFKPGVRLGACVEPSDCDDPAAPQKVLISTCGENRIWGDPTMFGFLLLEGGPDATNKP